MYDIVSVRQTEREAESMCIYLCQFHSVCRRESERETLLQRDVVVVVVDVTAVVDVVVVAAADVVVGPGRVAHIHKVGPRPKAESNFLKLSTSRIR